MKYWAPINSPGGIDGNDSYINSNPGAGIQGSIPTFQSFEQTLRALQNLIIKNQMTPNGTLDDLQVTIATRSQRVNWIGTFGGGVNALSCTLDPVPSSILDLTGVPIRGLFSQTNTGPATLTVNGLTGNIRRFGGGALVAGDLQAGAIGYLVYDGLQFQAFGINTPGPPGAPGASGAAGINGSQRYDTPGSYTFTVPAGITLLFVQVWGAGGSGAVQYGTDDLTGGGAGGGGYAEGWLATTPAANHLVTVGQGGQGIPPNTGLNGYPGTSSSFGTFATAGGGTSGYVDAAHCGVGGTATGGQFRQQGGPGEDWGQIRKCCNGGNGACGGGAGGHHGVLVNGQAPGGGGGGGNASGYGGAGGNGSVIVRW
jgi:hypothetical protein